MTEKATQSTTLLHAQNIHKSFVGPDQQPLEVLKGIELSLQSNESLAITGQSGSGKTTLLALLAGLDRPTSGQVILAGETISEMSEEDLTRYRSQHIGMVFQKFHLMPHLTALENVSLPLEILRESDVKNKALAALDQVQLSARAEHFPNQLSGGECQRVAIARAFVTNPAILLADEPTGNLDFETGTHVANLFFDLVKQKGMSMLMVTHNLELAKRCDRSVHVFAGKLQ